MVPARSVSNSVGEQLGTIQRSMRIRVKTTGCRLPGQHLHCDGGVGPIAQQLPELSCLTGIGECTGVVAEPGWRGCEQCERRHQYAEGTAAPDLAQLIGARCHGAAWVTQKPAGQTEEN